MKEKSDINSKLEGAQEQINSTHNALRETENKKKELGFEKK